MPTEPHVGRHAVFGIALAVLRIPQVMRHKLQQQRLRRWPEQGSAGRRNSPRFQISQIGSQGSKGIGTHAFVDQVPQRLDVGVGEQLGELVAAVDRQHGGEARLSKEPP